MANKIFKISEYSPKSDDVFFFDNNIWMYLFCPLANFGKEKKQNAYSSFFNQLLSRKLHIYTNALVLSEFSNRYLRLDYDLARKDVKTAALFNNYKQDYVGSARYKATVNEVKICLNKIVQVCQRCSDEFNSINLEEVLNLFQQIGFNDSYYIHQAIKKNWKIVSDDSDFTKNRIADKNLTIISL